MPGEILEAHDAASLADYILQQLSNPAAMRTRIRQFNDTSKAETFDTLEFADGRVFERFSRPQLVEGRVVGASGAFAMSRPGIGPSPRCVKASRNSRPFLKRPTTRFSS